MENKFITILENLKTKAVSADGVALDILKEQFCKFWSDVLYPYIHCDEYEIDEETGYDKDADVKMIIQSLSEEIFEIIA